jgi:tetratricopeptide (TPR) repeat protein
VALLSAVLPFLVGQVSGQAAGPASIAQANAALQAGEADHALKILASLPQSGAGSAEVHNLTCRVRFTMEQWDEAATECEEAVKLDAENSIDHLWLGRALGQKAAHAVFISAFSLAKRSRAEFEEAVKLDPRNVEAMSDLGNFYRQAPAVVGGGIDKAQQLAAQLEKVDAASAHLLRSQIAEQQKDYATAERELKQSVTESSHPALAWSTLGGFYARRERFDEMEAAVHSDLAAALRDKHASVGLYDGAGLLIESKRDPVLAATMLSDYLSSGSKTEEAPAFIAHYRLAVLKQQLGDNAAAQRERSAALAMAPEYKPGREFNPGNAMKAPGKSEQVAHR